MTKTKGKTQKVKLELKVLKEGVKASASMPLDQIISEDATHPHMLYRAAVATLENKRLGTASVKMRGEVSGGGKKPWRQKGTGRARHGSSRSPIWRKGGVSFGPGERQYGITLPKRMRTQALIAGLRTKARSGKFLIVDDFSSKDGKTKEAAAWIGQFSLNKPLIIREALDKLILRAVRNLKHVSVKTSDHVAAYDILRNDECVVTRKGYERLLERLRAGVS